MTVEETSRRSGLLPASVSSCESAIEKHDECAAARSSSGLVLPSERSVRDAHVTGSSGVAPLLRLSVPLPWARSPSHTVFAVRSAIAMVVSLSFGWTGSVGRSIYSPSTLMTSRLGRPPSNSA